MACGPAHIHFLVSAPGYRELVTALYVKGDAHIADDVVFGSSADLVAELKQTTRLAPEGHSQHALRPDPFARERKSTRQPDAWVQIPRPSSRQRPTRSACSGAD
jgi:protocatechuate 3,4-dioxygenase beta subunit